MPHDKLALKIALKEQAKSLGFVACGVTSADVSPEMGQRLANWLHSGAQGEMAWMKARADERSSPRALWPEAMSVIMLGMSYAPGAPPIDVPARGKISIYAQGADYHDVVKKSLKALARWLIAAGGGDLKVFVDTAPVMEKPLGAAAGIGWQGKHTNLVSAEHGSWLFLGAIMTTLALDPDPPQRDQCGSCTACLRACPTDAFTAPYILDARRCISYLTIEHKGPIPLDLRAGIGNRIYGCDDCLAVCPWNKFADSAAANRAFLGRAELAAPALGDLLALDDTGFRAVFAGSPIKRIGRNRMVRNAAIAAGNSGDVSLVPALRQLERDVDPVVAEAVRWAVGRLNQSNSAYPE
ncbi:MAG: tRNA epoxyqueuosine(34) reductase QueG [Sphingomonadaceae bacterium]